MVAALARGALALVTGQPPHSINNEACDRSAVWPPHRGAASLPGLFVKDRSFRLAQWPESSDLGDGEAKEEEETTRRCVTVRLT